MEPCRRSKKSGLDEVVLIDFYECKTVECPTITVTAKNLPWQTELVLIGGNVYDSIKGVELEFACASPAFSFIAAGNLLPKMVNGNPLYEEFPGASAPLAIAPPYAGTVEVTGHDKNIGFENQEPIKVVP